MVTIFLSVSSLLALWLCEVLSVRNIYFSTFSFSTDFELTLSHEMQWKQQYVNSEPRPLALHASSIIFRAWFVASKRGLMLRRGLGSNTKNLFLENQQIMCIRSGQPPLWETCEPGSFTVLRQLISHTQNHLVDWKLTVTCLNPTKIRHTKLSQPKYKCTESWRKYNLPSTTQVWMSGST